MSHFFSFLLYTSVSLSQSLECENSLENYHQEMNMGCYRREGEWRMRTSKFTSEYHRHQGSTEVLSSQRVINLWLHLSENVLNLSYSYPGSINSVQSSLANETLKWQLSLVWCAFIHPNFRSMPVFYGSKTLCDGGQWKENCIFHLQTKRKKVMVVFSF